MSTVIWSKCKILLFVLIICTVYSLQTLFFLSRSPPLSLPSWDNSLFISQRRSQRGTVMWHKCPQILLSSPVDVWIFPGGSPEWEGDRQQKHQSQETVGEPRLLIAHIKSEFRRWRTIHLLWRSHFYNHNTSAAQQYVNIVSIIKKFSENMYGKHSISVI